MMSFKIFFEDEDEDSSFHHLESDFGFTMFISTENEGESSSRSSDFQSSKFYHTVTASGNFRVGTWQVVGDHWHMICQQQKYPNSTSRH
jgi:hypothetical protein